jgi:hypothetical protein
MYSPAYSITALTSTASLSYTIVDNSRTAININSACFGHKLPLCCLPNRCRLDAFFDGLDGSLELDVDKRAFFLGFFARFRRI